MYCKECGEIIADNAKFCPNCGTKQADDFNYIVSPQLTPSCNNIIDLRPLSKIKYTHDEGKRNAKTLR